MPKSPPEMGEAIVRRLPARTGRTFPQCVDLVRLHFLRACARELGNSHVQQAAQACPARMASEIRGEPLRHRYSSSKIILWSWSSEQPAEQRSRARWNSVIRSASSARE